MTFEFSNHEVKYDMPTLVNCARYGMPIPDDTCILLGQALSVRSRFENDPHGRRGATHILKKCPKQYFRKIQ